MRIAGSGVAGRRMAFGWTRWGAARGRTFSFWFVVLPAGLSPYAIRIAALLLLFRILRAAEVRTMRGANVSVVEQLAAAIRVISSFAAAVAVVI